jgi:hypothetical protein
MGEMWVEGIQEVEEMEYKQEMRGEEMREEKRRCNLLYRNRWQLSLLPSQARENRDQIFQIECGLWVLDTAFG